MESVTSGFSPPRVGGSSATRHQHHRPQPKPVTYHLKMGRKLDRSLAAVLKRQMNGAIRQVLTAGPDNPDAVHQVRMHLKKIRSALRLVRSALGARFELLDSMLRDTARRLSACRDEEVRCATFERLTAGLPEPEQSGLVAVRDRLAERRTAAMQVRTADRVRWLLALLRVRSALRPAPAISDAVVAAGWRDGFKRARKCWREVALNPHPELMHTWRKRVKTHWYHARLLRAFAPDAARQRRKQLRDLGDLLGYFHDLALLRDRLTLPPETSVAPEQVASLQRLIDAEQADLLEAALGLGRELFDRKVPLLGNSC